MAPEQAPQALADQGRHPGVARAGTEAAVPRRWPGQPRAFTGLTPPRGL